MEIAIWIVMGLLIAIVILLAMPKHASIRDPFTGDLARVVERKVLTRGAQLPLATYKSDEGKLIVYGAGLIELQSGFNGPVVFFRNDNPEGLNFYLDFIAYSWHPHIAENPLAVVSIVYDSTEPQEHLFEPASISMNQNFPEAAKDNGVFVRAWSGGNATGMQGSTGGRGIMVFTLQPIFRTLDFDGKIIVGVGGTQRFDVRTDAAGALRLGVVGWFAKTV